MTNLEEKVVNCYKYYLTRLTYGITNQNYCMLYGAILAIKNNITDTKYTQYFYNNLNCPNMGVTFPTKSTSYDVFSWTLSPSSTVQSNFVWNNIRIGTGGTFTLRTPSTMGYNFLYITAPVNRGIKIYDEMSDLVFNSTGSGSYEFAAVGEIVTGNHRTNIVYRKNNVYNTYNSVTYYITIF